MSAPSRLRAAAPFLVPFVLAWVIGACWALATPRFGGPDEPAHVRKAAGTVRLQAIGDELPGRPDWLRSFHVPGAYVAPAPDCFAFHPEIPASCQDGEPGAPAGDVDAESSASRYPPLSYAVVGLPSLVATGDVGPYLLRLVQVTIAAAAIGLASVLLRRSSAGGWAQLGLAVAATPMVAFLAGVVNPNTTEIVLLVPVWAALIVTVERGGTLGRAEAWTIAGCGAAAVLTRQLSALWLLLGAVVLVVVAGIAGIRRLLAQRRGRVVVGVLVAAGILQVAWLAAVGSLGAVADPRTAVDDPTLKVVRTVVGQVGPNVLEMIGSFGWLDTPAPLLTVAAWLALLGGLAVGVLVVAERRWALAVAAGTGLVVLVPLVLEAKDAHVTGYYWQGRYTLPLAVLLPVLAAVAVGRASAARLPARVAVAVAACVALGHVAAFYTTLRRNTVGIDGSLLLRGGWQPPLGAATLVVVHAAAAATIAVALVRTASRAPVLQVK